MKPIQKPEITREPDFPGKNKMNSKPMNNLLTK